MRLRLALVLLVFLGAQCGVEAARGRRKNKRNEKPEGEQPVVEKPIEKERPVEEEANPSSVEAPPGFDVSPLQDNSAVVGTSRELRNAVENHNVELILLSSDVSLRRDVWPEVPRHLPELNLVVKRNLTITSHSRLPLAALLDLDYMVNRIIAGSGVTVRISGIVMAGVTRDPLSYLTVPFFQFEPNGVVLLENCQYQIAIEPSRLGPLSIYPSKIASTARPKGYEDWEVKMKVVSRSECPNEIVREAPCDEGALWVESLSARATVFDAEYNPLGKAAFLLRNVLMVAINLDKGRPLTSDEILPGAKTLTVADAEELKAGLLNQNATLIYVADNIVADDSNFPSESRIWISRNVTITSHPALEEPARIDLQYAENAVTVGSGTMLSIVNLRFSNTSRESETFELIPFFEFTPDSIFSVTDVISEMVTSDRINKLMQLPFTLYAGQPLRGFEDMVNDVTAVDSEWCQSKRGLECSDGALFIKEGVRKVQVLDETGKSLLGAGFIVARSYLVLAREQEDPIPSGGKPKNGLVEAVSASTEPSSSTSGENGIVKAGRVASDTAPSSIDTPRPITLHPPGGKDKQGGLNLTITVYVLAGTLIVIAVLLVAIIWLWKGNKKSAVTRVDSKESTTNSVSEELLLEHQHVAQQLLGDVKLGALLGWGSFGRVYKGLWGGAQVAVKVILHQAMGADLDEVEQEANFSITLRHPNVVQTYHYATRAIQIDPDVLESSNGQDPPDLHKDDCDAGIMQESSLRNQAGAGSAAGNKAQHGVSPPCVAGMNLPTSWIASQVKSRLSDSGNTRTSKIQSWYSGATPAMTSNMMSEVSCESWKETWLVQEYCELGSLGKQNYLRANKHPSAWGLGEPDLLAILETCMDIARGMKYLHDNNVVHGDLKCDNVLLQRAAASKRGFLAKVADFGLSRQLQHNGTHMSTKSYGTITHMPPELLLNGHLSTKVDVYSFAIIMWELVAGEPPFKSLRHAEVMRTVVVDNARPKFAFGTPVDYVTLAEKCWDRDPELRPSFNGVLAHLDVLLKAEEATLQEGGRAASPAAHSYESASRPVTIGSRQFPHMSSSSYQTSDYSYRHTADCASLVD